MMPHDTTQKNNAQKIIFVSKILLKKGYTQRIHIQGSFAALTDGKDER
jgi:hypothetical protein